jgi:hypothetical protein
MKTLITLLALFALSCTTIYDNDCKCVDEYLYCKEDISSGIYIKDYRNRKCLPPQAEKE